MHLSQVQLIRVVQRHTSDLSKYMCWRQRTKSQCTDKHMAVCIPCGFRVQSLRASAPWILAQRNANQSETDQSHEEKRQLLEWVEKTKSWNTRASLKAHSTLSTVRLSPESEQLEQPSGLAGSLTDTQICKRSKITVAAVKNGDSTPRDWG